MNQDLGLKVLAQIMRWTDEKAHREFQWLKLMARLKYDGYRDFQAGMRFVESLATWLQQFSEPGDREAAYEFVRRTLVYIGPGEMQHLVEQFYPRTVRERIVSMVAAECNVRPYQVIADACAQRAEKRLRRQTLFMSLSDGARIDAIRRANSGFLGNEQFVSSTEVNTEKWRDLLGHLRRELNDPKARFRLVYLIDDFAGTGTSLLRFDEENAEWKGKLVRFKKSTESANEELDGDNLFEDEWNLCVHHYVASSFAEGAGKERLEKAMKSAAFRNSWAHTIHSSCGMTLPQDLPIDKVPGQHDNFIQLTSTFYDPILRTKHTDIGGKPHLGLGYGGCALPLVLEHNTPNNSVALLWAETNGGGDTCPMRPLFRRRQRHV